MRIPHMLAEIIGGRVKVAAVDDQVQEGARRFVLAGDGKTAVQITSEGAVDLSRETNGDVTLLVRLRRDSDVPKDLGIAMGCGAGCRGVGAVRRHAPGGSGHKWQVVGVPIRCFVKGGADTSKINETLIHRD